MHKIILYFLVLFPLFSEGQTLKGVVYGNDKEGKQSLPGVNIYWDGTTQGVVSQNDGSFEIKKGNNQHMLVFSYVGYNSKTVHVPNLNPLEITLEPNLKLEEVTIIQKDKRTYMSTMNPINSVRIGTAELHKTACCNLAESFETNPSVDVSYSDAVTGAKQIRLLGLDGIYSLLQIENLPDLRGLATNLGLLYVPGPWMESIQVSKGASSVINGYESIAGQINAEYKKPDSKEKIFLNTFTGADGRYEFNANTGFRVYKDELTTGLLVHSSGLARVNDHNHDGFLDEPLSNLFQIANRWKYTNYKGFMAQAGINILNEDRLGGETGFQKDMERSISNPYGISIKTNRTSGFVKIGNVSKDGHTAIALLSNFSRHKNNSFFGLTGFDASETRYYANLVLTRDLDKSGIHMLNSGVSFIYDSFNEKLYGITSNKIEKVPGVYSEYTYKPGDKLTLMAGLRADFHNMFGTFFTPRMHFRYQLNSHFTLRSSMGKGYRTANATAENSYLLASSRPISRSVDFFQEEAWNYGLSLVQKYSLLGRDININTEFYRTDFISQLIIDRESSAANYILSPLDGKSYSNSFQMDVSWQFVRCLDVMVAYRLNDVWQTIGGHLLEKPLVSRYKGLLTLNYTTDMKKWMFDYTVQLNGGGRLPDVNFAGKELMDYQKPEFPAYTVMNAQITKYFRLWNIYLGAENLTGYRQKHPVINSENPYLPGFDATTIWGPVMGRRIYAGLRFTLNYK